MVAWLIDETGSVNPADSDRLRTALGFADRPLSDRVAFLVMNMGYACITVLNGGFEVRWRPTFSRRETLVSALRVLDECGPGRVVVATYDTTWTNRLHPTTDSAQEAMLSLFATARCSSGGYFVARQVKRRDLETRKPIQRVLEATLDMGRSFDPLSLWSLLDRTVDGRYLLLEPTSERRLRIRALGSGYSELNQKWMKQAPGSFFEDHPDAAYARAAADGYWQALASTEPVLEDVEASLWMPSRGRLGLRYTRLLLPLIVNGQCYVMSTSAMHSIAYPR